MGQLVYLHNPVPAPGMPPKFHRKWTGPFVVREILSPTTCRISNPTQVSNNGFTVHFDRLKLSTRGEHIGSQPPDATPTVAHEVEV